MFIIDDDVILQSDFHIPDLGERIDAVVIPSVRIVHRKKRLDRLLVGFQNLEYGMAGSSRFSSRVGRMALPSWPSRGHRFMAPPTLGGSPLGT